MCCSKATGNCRGTEGGEGLTLEIYTKWPVLPSGPSWSCRSHVALLSGRVGKGGPSSSVWGRKGSPGWLSRVGWLSHVCVPRMLLSQG